MLVHLFSDSGDAYDSSQCFDEITDGAVLIALEEKAIAILVGAWPAAVTESVGKFHTLKPGVTFKTLEGGKYFDAFCRAEQAKHLLGWK